MLHLDADLWRARWYGNFATASGTNITLEIEIPREVEYEYIAIWAPDTIIRRAQLYAGGILRARTLMLDETDLDLWVGPTRGPIRVEGTVAVSGETVEAMVAVLERRKACAKD